MSEEPLRLLVFGAHPDDAEFHAGGLICRYCRLGHIVKIVSVTDGSAGHHRHRPEDLARIRQKEAADVAQLIGAAYEVWEFPDGELQPTLDVRRRIIREIRELAPHLVLTHRTNDYHPDHRAVGQAVQDASFTVTVPLILPGTPALREDPIVAYMTDLFTKPNPLSPDVLLDVTPQAERVVDMLECHRSQVYEWLPYNLRISDQVPEDPDERRRWLAAWYGRRARTVADRFRDELIRTFGQERGQSIEYAEAYEISEYAGELDERTKPRLFPAGD